MLETIDYLTEQFFSQMGISQDIMAVRLQKESRPISWRVYVPLRTE